MNVPQEVLRQMIEGVDYPSPKQVLSRLKAQDACVKLDGFPYSIATNVAHADIWNQVWIRKLRREKSRSPFPDFPAIELADWADTRDAFLSGIEEAAQLAKEVLPEDDSKIVLRIGIHTSYHIGQIVLMKRVLRLAKKAKA